MKTKLLLKKVLIVLIVLSALVVIITPIVIKKKNDNIEKNNKKIMEKYISEIKLYLENDEDLNGVYKTDENNYNTLISSNDKKIELNLKDITVYCEFIEIKKNKEFYYKGCRVNNSNSSYQSENIPLYGDVTNDGKVNYSDYQMLKKYLKDKIKKLNNEKAADLNCDNIINSDDLKILENYNNMKYNNLPICN